VAASYAGIPHIFGGQGQYVNLVSSAVGYTSGVFSFNTTVQNLTNLPMATSDGIVRDDAGIRVFLQDAPTTTGGSGLITVLNATGVSTFLATNQSYYQYGGKISGVDASHLGADGILASTEVSATRNWQFSVPATVTSFAFQVYVSTSTPAGVATPVPPVSIGITGVLQGGVPVNLSAVASQIDVTVGTSGGGTVGLFLSANCAVNSIDPAEVPVATATVLAGQSALSFNTAGLNVSGHPRFINGNYCIKAQLTSGGQTVTAGNMTAVTLANVNVFPGTLAFISATGGPTSALSSLNGLLYQQGSLTVSIAPLVYSSASPIALMSGYLTRNGVQLSGAPGSAGNSTFTSVVVTNGVVTVAFPATAFGALENYTSLPAGDTLYVTEALDASGNSIAVSGNQAVIAGGAGVRFDDQGPSVAPLLQVTAPYGYIGASYLFSSGEGGTPSDTRGVPPVQGVGGVTTTWYAGPAGAAGFGVGGSCSVSGLTVVVAGTDLPSSATRGAYRAKVIVRDALGNQTCSDVASTSSEPEFGVDTSIPVLTMTTANNGAGNLRGYSVSKNWSFSYGDSISGFDPAAPLHLAVVRNFFTTPSAAACVVGSYDATAGTCSPISTPFTSTFVLGQFPFNGGSIEMTGATSVRGYYSVTAFAADLAGNNSPSVTRVAVFDDLLPFVGPPTQQLPAVPAFGTATLLFTAQDNLDLASSSGRLIYSPVGMTSVAFASIAGTSFGPNFDASYVTNGPGSVGLSSVFLGLQGTDATNIIQANSATPLATVTVTDAADNTYTTAPIGIVTAAVNSNIFVGHKFTMMPSAAAPPTRQATTNMSIVLDGLINDPAFQAQPFVEVDVYKAVAGQLVLVAIGTSASVFDQDQLSVRIFMYTITGIQLTPAALNTFYAVGRNTRGDAVISQVVTVVNP
jgi:hypothetical protein